ncbi:MAG TPA: RES domain-containing protein [Chryseosolibacter sp.]|nr:RES domain-containing protein [Chryseosolibacter sp.]
MVHLRDYSEFNTSLFRARSIEPHEDLSKVKTYSYPDKPKSIGRANLKSKAVFYGSNDFATSALEFINTSNNKDIVYISEWQSKEWHRIKSFPLIDYPHSYKDTNKKIFGNLTQEQYNLIVEFGNILKGLYRREADYNFTSCFSHKLLYKMKMCDMIEYPSVVSKGHSFNYAVSTDFIDSHFYLKRVFKVEISGHSDYKNATEQKDFQFAGTFLEVGRLDEFGKIVYGPLTKEDHDFSEFHSDVIIRDGEVLKDLHNIFKSEARE